MTGRQVEKCHKQEPKPFQETLASGKVIPGFGHGVLRNTDPRLARSCVGGEFRQWGFLFFWRVVVIRILLFGVRGFLGPPCMLVLYFFHNALSYCTLLYWYVIFCWVLHFFFNFFLVCYTVFDLNTNTGGVWTRTCVWKWKLMWMRV